MSGEPKVTTVQLKFRGAEDLFNNYPINLICQVVDKSEMTIEKKKEEVREVVGGRYLDMLRVADTISQMNKEFTNISGGLNGISQLSSKVTPNFHFDERSVNPDFAASKKHHLLPEQLWDMIDQNRLLDASILLYSCMNEGLPSHISGVENSLLSQFPFLIEKQCTKEFMTCTDEHRPKVHDLFTAFALCFLCQSIDLHNGDSVDICSLVRYILKSITIEMQELFNQSSKQSIITGLRDFFCTLDSLTYVLFLSKDSSAVKSSSNAPDFLSLIPKVTQDSTQSVNALMCEWVTESSSKLVTSLEQVLKLVSSAQDVADIKKDVFIELNKYHSLWVKNMCVLQLCSEGQQSPQSLIPVFSKVIHSSAVANVTLSFHELSNSTKQWYNELRQCALTNTSSVVISKVIQPTLRLYNDMRDLELLDIPQTRDSIREEFFKLCEHYESILQKHPDDTSSTQASSSNTSSSSSSSSSTNEYLISFAFAAFSLQNMVEDIHDQGLLECSKFVPVFKSLYTQLLNEWIRVQLNECSAVKNALLGLNWDYRESQWYDSVNRWRQFSISEGDGSNNEETDVVYVPYCTGPAVVWFLIRLTRITSVLSTVTLDNEFVKGSRNTVVNHSYELMANAYIEAIDSILESNPSVASPGLLVMLFDMLLIQQTLCKSSNSQQTQCTVAFQNQIERVKGLVDPVDWTLAESYLYSCVEEYIVSMGLLIAPIISQEYFHQNIATSSKQTSTTHSILATPCNSIMTYPIPSQSIQMLLNAQIKNR